MTRNAPFRRSLVSHVILTAVLLVVLITPGLAAPARAATISIPAALNRQQASFLDVEWYRENLIRDADLWNGGLDGQSGMGVYNDDFNGFFHVTLGQNWKPLPMRGTTGVAQSRAIYMNVEAYRIAGPEEGERFLQAVNQG